MRPSDVVTDATVDEHGAAQICATIVVAGGGRNPFEDHDLSLRIESDAMPGMRLIGGRGSGDSMTATCWQATGSAGG